MKLYQVPNNTWVKLIDDAKAPAGARPAKAEEEIFFYHLDGMYSFCKDREENVMYIPSWQEVQLLSEG